MLELRTVPAEELPIVYDHIKRDFPLQERFPYFVLHNAVVKGSMTALFLTEDNEDTGYAVCVIPEGRPYLYVQYFGIVPFCRNMGYGSRFLQLLSERYAGHTIILDAEDPEYARTGREYRIRKKRIAFYERSGFAVQKNVRLNLLGVQMLCLASGGQQLENPREIWHSCYSTMMPFSWLDRLINIYSAPYTGSSTIRPGQYRHFKGGLYEVIGIARHSETLEPMVIYKALYGEGGYWVRPAAMWNEIIHRDGKQVRRFTYIGR